jgi:hypothetical protein
LAAALLALAWQQVGKPPPRVELTGTDLFSRGDWKSTEVTVAGFYLGMPVGEAGANAVKHGFRLRRALSATEPYDAPCPGVSECYLLSTDGKKTGELTTVFSKDGKIAEIDIGANVDPQSAQYHTGVLREVKGQTYRFLNGPYSDALRLELFGHETTRELVDTGNGPMAQDTRYTYSERGIIVTVSPDPVSGPYLSTVGLAFPSAPGTSGNSESRGHP